MPSKKEFLIVGLLAVAIASGSGLPELRKDPSSAPPILGEVTLAAFRRLAAEKSAVILDARGAAFYAKAHVPGARNLPKSDFLDGSWNRSALADVARDSQIIVYCSSEDCPDSSDVVEGLAQLGYHNAAIFKGGMKAWTEAGFASEGAGPQ
jgi:rhodanese-related sulfurtransferase